MIDYEEPFFLDDVPQDVSALHIGSKVRHANFGEGIVQTMSGHGEAIKVTVDFSLVGPKKLMLKYAKLEII